MPRKQKMTGDQTPDPFDEQFSPQTGASNENDNVGTRFIASGSARESSE